MSPTNEQLEQLRLVLAHEYRRCDQAFLDFLEHATNQLGLGWSKENALSTYDSYARFLHHLYEFYVGCFKRNKGNLEKIRHTELDDLFQTEAEKLMGLRRWRIERGHADTSENHISYYEDSVPENFATDFRQTRNRIAHTDLRRSGANGALTLPDFFEKYHKFILILYEEPYGLWHVKADSYDWGEIERFGKIVNNKSLNQNGLSIKNKVSNFLFYKKIKKAISFRKKNGS